METNISWEKQVARPNSAHAWGLAMERMIEKPPKGLPLKSHGYLRAIAYDIADEMDKQREVKKNRDERPTSNVQHRTSNEKADLKRMTAGDMKAIRRKNMKGKR